MPAFSDIPMPAPVKALPTTASGMPVPYTTRYHDDDNNDLTRLDRSTGELVLACDCRFGIGRPKLGKPCAHRQRRAMLDCRCVVCGRRIISKAVLVFLGIATGHIEGQPILRSIEPPAHAHCAAYSALACPHLAHGTNVQLALTRHYDVWKEIMIPGAPRKDLKPLHAPPVQGGAVDLYSAIIDPRRATVVALDDWLATDAPKPYREYATRNGNPVT